MVSLQFSSRQCLTCGHRLRSTKLAAIHTVCLTRPKTVLTIFLNVSSTGVLDERNSSLQGNFSCYERRYGYYADIQKKCAMFHLCYPVKDSNTNEIVYQRFSFACSDNSIFDQQHLLCLDENSLATKCENSPDFFNSSNERLVASLQQSAPGLFTVSIRFGIHF